MPPQDPWEASTGDNGWTEYKRLVLNELERTNHRLDMVDKRLLKIERHLAIVQTKVATWAAGIAIIISGGMSFLIKIL